MNADTYQRVSSILRQVAAYAAIVFAALTSAINGIKLPAAASAVLGVFGTVILGIEHYVGNPSTGNNVTNAPPSH